MVQLQLGRSNAELLDVAADLAERFDAGVIGITACQPMQMAGADGFFPAELIEKECEEEEFEIKVAEIEFRNVLGCRANSLEWRSTVTFTVLSNYLADEARSADLVITSVDRSGSLFDSSRYANIDDLVMQLGRPVLLVPTAVNKPKFDRIVIGWKDTRETRHAAVDALPFLKKATHVAIVEIAAEDELAKARAHLKDVVGWLKRHGIAAESIAAPSSGADATRLNAIAREQGADLIVAGAYGHSRLREWVLGGVTRDLLRCVDRCSLVSH
jgi:nucleotide-binding universal stress UspA family protein